jgi:hypothetical protein
MKIKYKDIAFRQASLDLIRKADQVCRDYESQGLVLTLRQLYYVFVSRDWIPNRVESYTNLGNLINNGRLAGLIDWDHLEDRTRNLYGNHHSRDPAHAVEDMTSDYMLNHWVGQEYYVEIWVEKEALASVIARAARRLDCNYFACKGYVSQSEMHSAAMRLRHYSNQRQQPVIIHLGDHDPSGIDMTRDIEDRLDLFGAYPQVNRIALNMDQIVQYDPAPNPAKQTDTRFADYAAKYGDESWELDALDPATLDALIETAVLEYRDEDIYRDRIEQERKDKAVLTAVHDNWGIIREYVEDNFVEEDEEDTDNDN